MPVLSHAFVAACVYPCAVCAFSVLFTGVGVWLWDLMVDLVSVSDYWSPLCGRCILMCLYLFRMVAKL